MMLFLLDLALLCFLVPRSTKMTVRLACMIAVRAILTALCSVANVGIYQALLANNGKVETTSLAKTVNSIFGLKKDNCPSSRGRRDTWESLLSKVEGRVNVSDLLYDLDQNNFNGTLSQLEEEERRRNMSYDLDFNNTIKQMEQEEKKVNLDFDLVDENFANLKMNQNLTLDMDTRVEPAFDYLNCDLRLSFWAGVISVVMSAMLSMLAAANLALTWRLVNRHKVLLRKEEQLKEGFQALEEIHKLGQIGWEVNVN